MNNESTIDPAKLKVPEIVENNENGSSIDPRNLKVPKLTKTPTPPSPPSNDSGGRKSHETNADFIEAVFDHIPDGASPAVCSKSGDPTEGGWHAAQFVARTTLPDDKNNYFNCSSFFPPDQGLFSVKKGQYAAYHCLMLDDLGTKVAMEKLGDFELSWLIETSPGNFQGGVIFKEPITDVEEAERLQKAVLSSGFGDEGASGVSRWARLPNAINGKEKYRKDGKPFQCRLVEWQPDKRYSVQEIVDGLKLELAEKKVPRLVVSVDAGREYDGDDVFTQKFAENPVIGALKEKNLYKAHLGSGKHDITCPWVGEHTDGLDSGTAYFEPNDQYPVGGFKCMHSHGDKFKIKQLIDFLELDMSQARNVPRIDVVPGDLHGVVDEAEQALVRKGKHFQSGGLIVSIVTDASTGDPTISPVNKQALSLELSKVASWERFDARKDAMVVCDPPQRHVGILFDLASYQHLLPLKGLARQPFYRESDGTLVTESGYDKDSCMFGVFDLSMFAMHEPTEEAAHSALALLQDLLDEFRFVSDCDRAAALSAILTAAVRPSLPHAPGFHVRAPSSGSGKSYLCELISAFAGPAGSAKVSYPKTSEEASKVLLSLLLVNPAVVEFDDMDTDWVPHGVINRVLTAEAITERILGISKTATVTTRTLLLGSGNNVGPVRDLLRRVLTINIDPQCSAPATIKYAGSPVDEVLRQRGKYVAAALTIIEAWKRAGSPRADVESIVTYSGAWADYCRYPLMWLGLPDPAMSLLEQVNHDPDAEPLGRLLAEWYKAFGSIPTTVRKALAYHPTSIDCDSDDLMDAIREFPVMEYGKVNPSKLGWLLKKNAARIINGLKFVRAEADGRTAWMVVKVDDL